MAIFNSSSHNRKPETIAPDVEAYWLNWPSPKYPGGNHLRGASLASSPFSPFFFWPLLSDPTFQDLFSSVRPLWLPQSPVGIRSQAVREMTHHFHLASILISSPETLLPQPTHTRSPGRERFLVRDASLAAMRVSQGLLSSLLREGSQRSNLRTGKKKMRNSAAEMQTQSTELSVLGTNEEERAVVQKIQNSG